MAVHHAGVNMLCKDIGLFLGYHITQKTAAHACNNTHKNQQKRLIVAEASGRIDAYQIRDLILGYTPPNMFRNPIYTMVALGVSCTRILSLFFRLFLLCWRNKHNDKHH